MVKNTPIPFASHQNFLDPELTSDGRPYAPMRFKEIVRERFLISKFCSTSYTDLGEITPLERKYLLEFVEEDLHKKQELMDSQTQGVK